MDTYGYRSILEHGLVKLGSLQGIFLSSVDARQDLSAELAAGLLASAPQEPARDEKEG